MNKGERDNIYVKAKVPIQRNFRDRLFRMIFGEDKKELLSLYNAVNGTTYEKPEELEFNTLDDVIYMGMKNDVSFLFEGTMNLYEHQSTICGNLPLRGLFYLADVYKGHVESIGANIYGTKTIRLPLPQYVVFYNGEKEAPDREIIYLEDMFFVPPRVAVDRVIEKTVPCLTCNVTILNINYGHNKEILEKCKKLNEYAIFVSHIRSYLKAGKTLKESVDCTVRECIKNHVLKEFLQKNRAEVENVILTEYNEELHLKSVREEGKSEGRSEGKIEEIIYLLSNLGEIPRSLEQRIVVEENLETLRKWIKNAARAESLKEFQDKM